MSVSMDDRDLAKHPSSRSHFSDVTSDAVNDAQMSGNNPAWRIALELWLRWNTTYESVTESMYQAGSDQRMLEQTMDQLDQLRFQAIELSRQLVES
jgi:hypothetical protein